MFSNINTRSFYDEGSSSIASLCKRAEELNYAALCIADKNLTYVPEFLEEAPKHHIKPLLGRTFELEDGSSIILIAKNGDAFSELCRLSSISNRRQDGKISMADVKAHSFGLICVYCHGSIHDSLLRGQSVDDDLFFYDTVFRGDVYFETCPFEEVNRYQIALQEQGRLKLVASCAALFSSSEDYPAHIILKGRGSASPEQYLKPEAEMLELFKENPEAIMNVGELVGKVSCYTVQRKSAFPKFPIPPEFHSDVDYLRGICLSAMIKRFDFENYEAIWSRVKQELAMVEAREGAANWFLVISDLISALRQRGIKVAPGPGTAAGSILSYLLGISVINPLLYDDVYFENHINNFQVAPCPEMDIILEARGASEAYSYLSVKYPGHVCCGVLLWRKDHSSALSDVLESNGVSRREIRDACRSIPECKPFHSLMPYTDAGCPLPEAKALIKWYNSSDDGTRALFRLADRISGTVIGSSAHAFTIIMSEAPMGETIPTHLDEERFSENIVVTSDFDSKYISRFGARAINLVWSTAMETDDDSISYEEVQRHLDDKETLDLFAKGAEGITFFDTREIRSWLRQFKPQSFEDIVVLHSLIKMNRFNDLPEIIRRKRENNLGGNKAWGGYLSYGSFLIHEETIQTLAVKVAGMSPKQAWLLKERASKQKPGVDAMRVEFVSGAMALGYDESDAAGLFEFIKREAPYTYRKSHSISCALTAFKSAYLMAHPTP